LELSGIKQIASGWVFCIVTALVVAAIAWIIWSVEKIKAKHPPRMIFLQILFGR
jgi:hypothetical protein